MINYSQFYKSSNKQSALIPAYLTYCLDSQSNKQHKKCNKYNSMHNNSNNSLQCFSEPTTP
nr:MAG TPA: hypothetical protein [Caudoviricetes sp.]